MAVENESIGLRISRELGNDVKDFLYSFCAGRLFHYSPSLLLDSLKIRNLSLVSI